VTSNANELRQHRFHEIIDQNRDRFGRIARIYAGVDVDDLVQEILMQIWKSLPQYDGQAKLGTWSYRIAINTAISWKRNATRIKRQPPSQRTMADTLKAPTYFSCETELLERFMNSLSEIDQAVLLMYLDDLTNQEIADSIGVNCSAIRTRISRIREKLKSWEDDDG
jgi:RNA polymerase sigma factor (sigma-70 family)